MNIVLAILGTAFVVFWAFANLYTAKMFDAREMYNELIVGRRLVSKIFANVFYLPAWLLKAVRFLIIATIK